ncbi:MAG: hypothetical protein J1E56_01970 [Ruminococcus sp.]|nr:hypothetical protein [Ruminococcus sp.]
MKNTKKPNDIKILAITFLLILTITSSILIGGCSRSGFNNLETTAETSQSTTVTEVVTEAPTTEEPTTEEITDDITEEPTTEKQTEKPTEKPTEKLTEKPTEKATKKPTEKPTDPPTDPPRDLEVIYVSSPVSPGEYADITVQGEPNTDYSITVYYKSGPSTAKGLYTKTSDSNGNVSWEWKVGTRTSSGTYRISISGGGQSISTTFTVL